MKKYKINSFLSLSEYAYIHKRITIVMPTIRVSGIVEGVFNGLLHIQGYARGINFRGEYVDVSGDIFAIDIKGLKKNYNLIDAQIIISK